MYFWFFSKKYIYFYGIKARKLGGKLQMIKCAQEKIYP